MTHPLLANPDVDIFTALRDADVLVHHPYTSFASSVVEFIEQAADLLDVENVLFQFR